MRGARHLLAVLLLPLPLLLTGCGTSIGPAGPPPSRLAADQRLAQSAPEAINARTAPMLTILTDNLKPAFDQLDAGRLEAALAANFQRAVIVEGQGAALQTRADVLAEARRWRKGAASGRDLAYAVQEASLSEDGNEGSVLAIATYRTKYFAPRVLELLKFVREPSGWRLSRQVQQPLYPAEPRMHEVRLIGTGMIDGASDETGVLKRLSADGPVIGYDAVLDALPPGPSVSGDKALFTVPLIFKEPPAPGSKLAVDWILKDCPGGVYRGRFFEAVVSAPSMFFVPAVWGAPNCGDRPTAMELVVLLDGVAIGGGSIKP